MENRQQIYDDLLESVKELLIKIYGNENNFINAPENSRHPLEPYLLSFNENMNKEITVIMGNRIGIVILDNEEYLPFEQFIDSIDQYLDIESSIPISTYKLINATRSEFDEILKKYGGTPSQNFYDNRLFKFYELVR